MPETKNVAVIIGSLRTGSYSRKLAHALIERAPSSLAYRIVEIADLPLYNEDLDPAPPAPWERFRKEVKACQAVLCVTPEYNRSIPGALKNALDVGSRPPGQSVWDRLPLGIASCSPYGFGGFGGNLALRQVTIFLNMPVMQQPECYIAAIGSLMDDDGHMTNPETDEFLRAFMEQFSSWVARTGTGAP